MMPGDHVNSGCRTLGPYARPALCMMSINVDGLSAIKEQYIADLSNKHKCDMVCLQRSIEGLTISIQCGRERGH